MQNLVIVRFHGPVSETDLDVCRATFAAALAAYPPNIAALAVVTRRVPVGPPPIREASTRLLRDFFGHLHTAVAIEGEDVVSATKRTVVSTVVLLSRNTRHTKIFSNAEDGAQWLAARLKGHLPPITKILEILRSAETAAASTAAARRIGVKG